MRSYSDVATQDNENWLLKPEYLLFLNHWDGFTEKLWFYDLLIDKDLSYSIIFRSYAISYAKQESRAYVELKGIVPKSIADAIYSFSEIPFEPIVRTPKEGVYEAEDGGSDSYLIATASGTLNCGFRFGLIGERTFVNDTEKELYALHLQLRDWLYGILSEADKQHSIPD